MKTNNDFQICLILLLAFIDEGGYSWSPCEAGIISCRQGPRTAACCCATGSSWPPVPVAPAPLPWWLTAAPAVPTSVSRLWWPGARCLQGHGNVSGWMHPYTHTHTHTCTAANWTRLMKLCNATRTVAFLNHGLNDTPSKLALEQILFCITV